MDSKLIAQYGELKCEIGKKSIFLFQGYFSVNVMTNFEPLEKPIFLLELKASKIVARMTNVAFYSPEDGGGISILLSKDHDETDLWTEIQSLLTKAALGLLG